MTAPKTSDKDVMTSNPFLVIWGTLEAGFLQDVILMKLNTTNKF